MEAEGPGKGLGGDRITDRDVNPHHAIFTLQKPPPVCRACTKGGHPVDVRMVCKTGVEHHEPEDLHVFVVLHAPLVGQGGHVHCVELDQFIGNATSFCTDALPRPRG